VVRVMPNIATRTARRRRLRSRQPWVMPNIAAKNGSMAAAVVKTDLTDEVSEILGQIGVLVEVEESLIDISTAVNGAGPAFASTSLMLSSRLVLIAGLNPNSPSCSPHRHSKVLPRRCSKTTATLRSSLMQCVYRTEQSSRGWRYYGTVARMRRSGTSSKLRSAAQMN